MQFWSRQALLFMFFTILSAVMEGSQGIAATQLTSNVSATSTTLPVTSGTTTQFIASGDFLWIDDERMAYTGVTAASFTGVTRGIADENGYGGTAAAHLLGTVVRNEGANLINSLIGYNAAAASATTGSVFSVIGTGVSVIAALPRMIIFDYSWLSGDLAILRMVFLAICYGPVLYLVLSFLFTQISVMKP